MNDKNKRIRGPESAFYDTLKGQDCIFWIHGSHGYHVSIDGTFTLPLRGDGGVRAKLIWVDKYTIGIRLPNGSEDMLNKKFIIRTKRDDNAGAARDSNQSADPHAASGLQSVSAGNG